jgi:UDP-N-acetyl-D-galactosamine dehydrogenase
VAFGKKQEVVGFDISKRKIDELSRGIESMGEVPVEELKKAKILFTNDSRKINDADFIIVAVPTPVDEHNVPDMKYVESASEVVGKNISKGSIVVFESTVYPGVTEDICVPIIEKESGLKCGKDWKIGYSPERVNPGDKVHTTETIVKVVSGMDKESLDIIANVYSLIIKAGFSRRPALKLQRLQK